MNNLNLTVELIQMAEQNNSGEKVFRDKLIVAPFTYNEVESRIFFDIIRRKFGRDFITFDEINDIVNIQIEFKLAGIEHNIGRKLHNYSRHICWHINKERRYVGFKKLTNGWIDASNKTSRKFGSSIERLYKHFVIDPLHEKEVQEITPRIDHDLISHQKKTRRERIAEIKALARKTINE